MKGKFQIELSQSSGGVINSPWNVLDTSEGSFFILQQLNQFFLTFEISSIENGGCWVKRQGGTVILKSGTPTGFYTFLQVPGPYRVEKAAQETLLSKTFPTKKNATKNFVCGQRETRLKLKIPFWKSKCDSTHCHFGVLDCSLTAACCLHQDMKMMKSRVSNMQFQLANFESRLLSAQKELGVQISQGFGVLRAVFLEF